MDIAIYARLSQEDRTTDEEATRRGMTATERQISDCRDRAAREGWNVVAVYEDPDHSASIPGRRRPEFERMLGDLDDGVRVDAVLCWKYDRLLRRPVEAERIIDLADRRGFAIMSLSDPAVDLTTPMGRAMFRIVTTMAKAETETMALRIQRKARSNAEAGLPNGGIRAFGLDRSSRVIVPEEAVLVRQAADRLLAGESLHAIVTDWNLRGVRTPGTKAAPDGRKWEVSSLKRMLLSPRIVGDRAHHGVVVGTGVIPALLDRDTWARLQAALAAPRGRSVQPVRRHYLTGLLRCGRCGAKLVARPDWRGTTRYVCAQPRGCGGITVAKSNVEPLITEAIAQRLDSPEFHQAVEARSGATAAPTVDVERLRADQQALEEVAQAYYVERAITKPEFLRVRATLEARIDEARRRLERVTADDGLGRVAALDIRAEWATRPAVWQSEVARTVIDRITVNPAARRGTRFDPSRIDVEWRV